MCLFGSSFNNLKLRDQRVVSCVIEFGDLYLNVLRQCLCLFEGSVNNLKLKDQRVVSWVSCLAIVYLLGSFHMCSFTCKQASKQAHK